MGKREILEKLAEITAAVEALPDDTHEGQGVLTPGYRTCPTCEGSRNVGEPGYTYYGIPEPGSFEACPDCMDAHGIRGAGPGPRPDRPTRRAHGAQLTGVPGACDAPGTPLPDKENAT